MEGAKQFHLQALKAVNLTVFSAIKKIFFAFLSSKSKKYLYLTATLAALGIFL